MMLLVFGVLLALTVTAADAPSSSSWHRYVRTPKTRDVRPAGVFNVTGDVVNAQGLIDSHAITTFCRPRTIDPIPSVVLDFGINIVGYPWISFASASKNKPGLRLAFSETLQYLTNISDFTRSNNGDKITPGTDQFAVPSHPHTWTDTHSCLYNNTKVCADGLHGSRHMRVALDALPSDAPYTSPNGTFSIDAVGLHFAAFLGTPETFTGSFECSDESLTQYWYDAAYTNDMCIDDFRGTDVDPRQADSPSLEGQLVLFDGAKRDRDPYVGDITVSGLTKYLTHDAGEAVRNVLADLAEHQRGDGWIPPASIKNYSLPLFDYPLHWVVSSWEYVLYTGDVEYASTYYENLVAVLDHWYLSVTGKRGLLSKGLNGTSGYGDYAFLPRTGEVTYYNALHVLALQSAAAWASYLRDTSTSKRWMDRANGVSKAINKHLWDPIAGAYLDSANLTNGKVHPQDGNSIAILAGVAPRPHALSALNYLSTHDSRFYGNAFYDGPLPGVPNATDRVCPFTSFFELQARFLTNQPDSALEQIDRMYGWMASQDPGVTMWEGIGPNGTKYEGGFTSLAHGWSTGIVSLLSNYVLGVVPKAPGFETWSIKPCVPTRLEWAKGEVPTPFGPLRVSWRKIGRKGLLLEIDAPEGSMGTVAPPVASNQTVRMDGLKIALHDYNAGHVTIANVKPGHHRVEVL